MSDSEICVLVTGVGGGSLGRELMKAFSMASQKYKIIATDMAETSLGLFETKHRYVIPPALSPEYIESLIKICKKENVHAIAPGSEPEIEQVVKNTKIFQENGIKVLANNLSVIDRCKDKYELVNFLKSNGIATPKHFLYQNEEDVSKIESYPVIVKPRSGVGSRNVFIAQDEKELIFFGDYLKKYGFEPLVQEYLGNYEEEYTVGVLYADNGRLLTSIAMRRMLSGGLSTKQIAVNPENQKKYVTSSGISQGFIDDFELIRKAGEKIAKVLGSNGPINIQCRKTESGIIPFEVNPRFSGTTGARSKVGHNEPDIFCRFMMYDEIPSKTEYKFGYALRDLVEKYISIEEIKNVPRI
jgi:carbamoyl-phosphate synthase large subunit